MPHTPGQTPASYEILTLHGGAILNLAWLPDSSGMVSGPEDMRVRIGERGLR